MQDILKWHPKMVVTINTLIKIYLGCVLRSHPKSLSDITFVGHHFGDWTLGYISGHYRHLCLVKNLQHQFNIYAYVIQNFGMNFERPIFFLKININNYNAG